MRYHRRCTARTDQCGARRDRCCLSFFFFLNDPATTEIYTLSLHDALRISTTSYRVSEPLLRMPPPSPCSSLASGKPFLRSEEHTSELQSHLNLVCRLLLEKKNRYTLHLTKHWSLVR